MLSFRKIGLDVIRTNFNLLVSVRSLAPISAGVNNDNMVNFRCRFFSFKSELSLEKLYPNSNTDFLRQSEQSQQSSSDSDKFSGFIPVEQLEITHNRSSGPGGQNVNKVNSKVEVRFHVESAHWIPEWIRPRLLEQEQNRITKDGFLVIKSDMTRKQMLNQADCVNKLRNMIHKASILPKELTKEEIKLKEQRLMKAKSGILKEKRNKSLLKKSRSSPEL